MACPLCGNPESRPSWLGTTRFRGRDFAYSTCSGCGSMYVDPMPDDDLLARMYGPEYVEEWGDGESLAGDGRDPERVIGLLRETPPGRFLDYGCGEGHLLVRAAQTGWHASGVEFDPRVAQAVAARTGARVVSERELDELPGAEVDVLHLGDVLEHIAHPERDLRRILRLLCPGGRVVAQGPLEAQPNLFLAALRLSRWLRRDSPASTPPYHVTLATAAGQRALFERVGLLAETFEVSEVSWPAPAELTRAVAGRPRALALLALRRVSQAASRLNPKRWGNRYFFVGRVG